MSDALDFELDLESRMAGAAAAVTQLDRFEASFKAAKTELATLEKTLAGVDKAFEKNAAAIADARVAMQRAMQDGDDKKFWKLAQTIDALTKKEDALRKKSAEAKLALDSQTKTVQTAADRVGALRKQEAAHEKVSDLAARRADQLSDRFGRLAHGVTGAADDLATMGSKLGTVGSLATLAAGGVLILAAALTAALLVIGASVISLEKYALKLSDMRREQRLTLTAITQSNEAGAALNDQFQNIAKGTGVTEGRLTEMTRELYANTTAQQRARLSGAALERSLYALAEQETALGDTSGTSQLIDQLKTGAITAERLGDRIDQKYSGVLEQKMLGLDHQLTTLEKNVEGLFSGADLEPFLRGLSRVIALFDKSTASGAAIKTLFDAIFGPASGELADRFFIGLERWFLKTEIIVLTLAIAFEKAWKRIKEATDIDLGPFGNLHDRLADLQGPLLDSAQHALAFLNPITAIGQVMGDVASAVDKGKQAFKDFQDGFDKNKTEQLAKDFIDGFVNGLDAGIKRVEDKVKEVGSAAVKALKDKLGIHSPSTVMDREVGVQIPAGIAQGIDRGADSVGRAVDELVEVPTPPKAGASSASTGAAQITNVFHIAITGVDGVEDATDRLEEEIVAIFERRSAQIAAGVR